MKHWKSTVAVLAALALAGCNTTAEKKEPVKNTAKPAGKPSRPRRKPHSSSAPRT